MASTTQDFNGWRSEILEHIFNEEDSKEIQQMSLVNIVGQDKIFWRLGSNGDYSVRSAYHHLMENMLDNEHLKVEGGWMQIWRLKIPPKFKHFLWSILRGCLPCKQNIQKKGVQSDNSCCYCSSIPENE